VHTAACHSAKFQPAFAFKTNPSLSQPIIVIAFLAWKAHLALIHVYWHPSAVVAGGSEYSQVKALNTHSAADS